MYTPKQVDGQDATNRIRANIARLMEGRPGTNGLPSMSANGLFKFMSGGCDITVTRADRIARDLGVALSDLLVQTESDATMGE